MDSQQKNPITEGSIYKQLLIFFFPILMGTFFQQLYNTVDAIIIGKFVGKVALGAVGGATGTIINLLVGFFTGLLRRNSYYFAAIRCKALFGYLNCRTYFSRSRDCLRDFHVNTRAFARRHGTSRNGHAGGYLSSCRHISEHIFRRNPVFYDI